MSITTCMATRLEDQRRREGHQDQSAPLPQPVETTPSQGPLFAVAPITDTGHAAPTASLYKVLEGRSLMYFEAINRRSWNPQLPPWTFNAQRHFRAGIPCRDDSIKSAASVLDAWKDIVARYPDYHMHVTGVSVNMDPQDGSLIEVYVNLSTSGEAEGVVKKVVTKIVWVYLDAVEDWRATYTESFAGVF